MKGDGLNFYRFNASSNNLVRFSFDLCWKPAGGNWWERESCDTCNNYANRIANIFLSHLHFIPSKYINMICHRILSSNQPSFNRSAVSIDTSDGSTRKNILLLLHHTRKGSSYSKLFHLEIFFILKPYGYIYFLIWIKY